MAAIKTALISVTDKSGLEKLATTLQDLGIRIISSGGTCKFLQQKGFDVIPVESFTGFPEILGGRVKTLHPRVFAGILARRDQDDHLRDMERNELSFIDMVVCNLYAFRETIAKADCTAAQAIESIDIGGPSLIRAAAKNHRDVAVVTDINDYDRICTELKSGGGALCETTQIQLAGKAFRLMADYNATIGDYFAQTLEDDRAGKESHSGPVAQLPLMKRQQVLRYGENPHQGAEFYVETAAVDSETLSLARLHQLHGKELSFNNIADINAGIELLKEFDENAACVIIKHCNPCGVGFSQDSHRDAYEKALHGDSISAFGGIVALNGEVDEEVAQKINSHFFEVIIAPSFSDSACQILFKKKNLRIVTLPIDKPLHNKETWTRVQGGMLKQDANTSLFTQADLEVVTTREPSLEELCSLHFAWRVCKHVKSNAIVLADGEQSIGIGAGQMSRIDALDIATAKKQALHKNVKAFTLASDAFFPFRDVVEKAKEIGVTAIIQPGGSMRDQESIDAANEAGIAMVFTRTRQFKH